MSLQHGKFLPNINLSFFISNNIRYKSYNIHKQRFVMDLSKYLEVALAVHAACSVITALTPTPRDDNFVRKAYKVIEILALVVGKAKQR